MIATTIEQSTKLLSLGLIPNTADMYWDNDIDSPSHQSADEYLSVIGIREPNLFNDLRIPAWSLSALLDLMPVNRSTLSKLESQYLCRFRETDEYTICRYGDTAIESVYKMVCWLLDNGYVK